MTDETKKPEVPKSGGRFVRAADGTLKQVAHPTAPEGFVRDHKGDLIEAPAKPAAAPAPEPAPQGAAEE